MDSNGAEAGAWTGMVGMHAGKGRLVLSKTPCGKVPPPPPGGHASFHMDVPRTFQPQFRTLTTPTPHPNRPDENFLGQLRMVEKKRQDQLAGKK